MAASRSEKTTIPASRNPLADVTYSQDPKPQHPIDSLINDTSKDVRGEASEEVQKQPAAKSQEKPEPKPRKEKITVVIPDDLLERLRNAAWWQRQPMATLAEEGLRHVLEKMEREHGGPFKPREKALKTGRPLGSKNLAKRAR